jgi:hypothetical protein
LHHEIREASKLSKINKNKYKLLFGKRKKERKKEEQQQQQKEEE